MKIAYFDCFSGISGDMILGALTDLSDEPSYIQNELKKLELRDYFISCKKVKRGVIEATKIDVNVTEELPANLNLSDIINILESGKLSQKIKDDSIKVFKRLAKAEAAVHGSTIGEVHFHEVGAIDSIVDIVGSVIGLNQLGISKIVSSPVNTGSGLVKCDHGVLPVPVPAVAELLKGFPCYSSGIEKELTTPTGAAIITTLADEFASLPGLKIEKVGYGAGSSELKELPNVLRIISGEELEKKRSKLSPSDENLYALETNIDDMNPEFYELVMEKLLKAGAVDVFLSSIQMKKNRPATKLSVLTNKNNIETISNEILKNTTSFGVRFYPVQRIILDREFHEIETAFGRVKVKIGKRNGEIYHISPEYEKCKKISKQLNIPIKKVYEEIQFAINNVFKK